MNRKPPPAGGLSGAEGCCALGSGRSVLIQGLIETEQQPEAAFYQTILGDWYYKTMHALFQTHFWNKTQSFPEKEIATASLHFYQMFDYFVSVKEARCITRVITCHFFKKVLFFSVQISRVFLFQATQLSFLPPDMASGAQTLLLGPVIHHH